MNENASINKILIIEDENFFLKPLSKAFKKEGFKVSEATNGDAGLKKVKHEKPDLIFLDIIMPGMDGLDVLKNIREDANLKHTPIVMLTSVEHSMREAEMENDSACIHIFKSNCNMTQLVQFVNLFKEQYSQGKSSYKELMLSLQHQAGIK